MADVYLDGPPPANQRIRELHVWIATYGDGSEGIISSDVPMPEGLGKRHMALLSSKLAVAQSLQPLARRAAQVAAQQAGRVVSIRLLTFNRDREQD